MQQIIPASQIGGLPQDVRRLGINLNHWYGVARSTEVKNEPVGVTLWQQAIVLFRDQTGQIQALEDRCPHRQVKLSHGKLVNDRLECAYHGWQFDAAGTCVAVPSLTDRQKLPNCRLRRYPVIEQDGFVWLFPGEAEQAVQHQPLALPEWEHLNFIGSVAVLECSAHYSFLIENLMDMYHGHLHQEYQAWADPVLQDLHQTAERVDAYYQAQSYYKIDRIWSIAQVFIPALRQLHPEPLNVSYVYPHWTASLGNDFKLYCLLCPIHETAVKAYLIHFTSLNAFDKLHKLPIWFRRFLKNRLADTAKGILENLIEQDVKMMEDEQQAYLNNPDQRNFELNRTVGSVQQLMRYQAAQTPEMSSITDSA